ncbi:MAG: MotA/TolQ/ExbB proton channel family protein [Candidatus Cloacimonadota bacterium]|nr:MotA/TolQ/ExbB proton channel family protein [Candidatus Cloacimonadota bacterium]
MSLFEIALKGGYLMIVLAILSILAVAVIIERIIAIQKSKELEKNFVDEITGYLKKSQIGQAIKLCDIRIDDPIARIFSKGLESIEIGFNEAQQAVEVAAKMELHKLEKNVAMLSTIAAVAPLVGFMGTVLGMIKVFMKIKETGGGVDISLLAGGIWEAMVTTVAGLAIGIISIIFYNYIVDKIEDIARELEEKSSDFLIDVRRYYHES